MNARICIAAASLALLFAVAFGAFGAHALRHRLSPELLTVYQTAVHYHFYHALGLFGIGLLWLHWPDAELLALAAWLMVLGLVLFSGSLYALAASEARWLGAITPFGGIAFIAAWGVVLWVAVRQT